MFSSVSIAFVIVTLVSTIANPHDVKNDIVTRRPMPRVLWCCFMAYKIITVVVKLVLFMTPIASSMSL